MPLPGWLLCGLIVCGIVVAWPWLDRWLSCPGDDDGWETEWRIVSDEWLHSAPFDVSAEELDAWPVLPYEPDEAWFA